MNVSNFIDIPLIRATGNHLRFRHKPAPVYRVDEPWPARDALLAKLDQSRVKTSERNAQA